MGYLIDWFFDLEGFELILWSIALLFSFLFVIQTVISFFIGGGDGDFDISDEGHGDASHFFTVRNMIAFFTMFGWTGLAAYKSNIPNVWVTVIAAAAGVLTVVAMVFLMKKASGFRASGTLVTENAVTKIGETYLKIPANRGGMGKVQIQVQGRIVELDAITDDDKDIATGKPIRVIKTLNQNILIVTSELLN